MLVFAFLALATVVQAACDGEHCADFGESEGDAGALLQVRTADVATTDRIATKPSDIAALLALWEANGRQGTLIGWGDGDPCYGEQDPAAQANAQGFGPWKGVACVPCPSPADAAYLCVSQIWQHQKGLNGTIPENFRGLAELEWLFLSANNLTGPMPQSNWFTFPKLRFLDISYNQINGVLPLDRLSSIPALHTINAHDNHFDSVCYHGGGFPELRVLDFMYNRNMTGLFPSEPLSKLPLLRKLQIHDTHLTGPVYDGPWPAIEDLIITGTGGLCGPLPQACYREEVFCDVISNFTACAKPREVLVFGTPLSGYHNATLWVYHEAMVQLGWQVTMVTKYIHKILYPMFTGHGGTDAGCTEEGCADKCKESGLGDKSPCIDFVVDSNIPVNHATWLKDYTDTFDVMGTAFESQFIGLFAPAYSGWKTIDQAATSQNAQKTILGFKSGPTDNCNTLYCPKCGDGSLPYITGPPLSTNGFDYKSYSCPDFEKTVAKKIERKKNFLVLMWVPQAMGARFPELVPVDMMNYTYLIKPNQGKAQVRKAARHKFDDKALSVLGAIFIGTEDVKKMDGWSHGIGLNKQLCNYQSWNTACSKEAAQKWILMNKDHGKTKGVWETFFW